MNFRTITKGALLNNTKIEGGAHTFPVTTLTIDADDFGSPGVIQLCRAQNDGHAGPVKATITYPGKAPQDISVLPTAPFLAASYGVPDTPANPSVDHGKTITVTFERPTRFFKQFTAK